MSKDKICFAPGECIKDNLTFELSLNEVPTSKCENCAYYKDIFNANISIKEH